MSGPGFSFSRSLTVAEFCDIEGISKNPTYKRIRQGELPAYCLSLQNFLVDDAVFRAEMAERNPDSSTEACR